MTTLRTVVVPLRGIINRRPHARLIHFDPLERFLHQAPHLFIGVGPGSREGRDCLSGSRSEFQERLRHLQPDLRLGI